jgi:hypothetical protein
MCSLENVALRRLFGILDFIGYPWRTGSWQRSGVPWSETRETGLPRSAMFMGLPGLSRPHLFAFTFSPSPFRTQPFRTHRFAPTFSPSPFRTQPFRTHRFAPTFPPSRALAT